MKQFKISYQKVSHIQRYHYQWKSGTVIVKADSAKHARLEALLLVGEAAITNVEEITEE